MAPIDKHLYDDTMEEPRHEGVAAPPRPDPLGNEAAAGTGQLNVARMRQILSEQGRQVADAIDPLQKKLDLKLHELDETLRPKLQQPVKEKPLLSVAISAGVGFLLGSLGALTLLGGTRSRSGD